MQLVRIFTIQLLRVILTEYNSPESNFISHMSVVNSNRMDMISLQYAASKNVRSE
jgi:hypothetical protein